MEQYISKSDIVSEIDKKLQDLIAYLENVSFTEQRIVLWAKIDMCKEILSSIDTLETEGVDLDKECRKYLTEHFNVYEDDILQSKRSGMPLDTFDVIKVAEHFFELGLKSKGE